jgi:hypothetical protein
MELTAAARLDRPPGWPGVVAWALWALGVLAIPVAVWLDRLLRQAGRSHHPVGWLLLALGLSLAAGGVAAAYVAYGLLARPGALPASSRGRGLRRATSGAATHRTRVGRLGGARLRARP